MAAAHARRLLRRRRQRKRRVFQRLRHPPTYLDNDAMFYRFRFSLATITFITDLLSPFITHPSRRSRALSPEQQVLVALRFFGSGSFFRIIGDTFGMSVATVSRCVSRVSLALCRVARRFVNVPMGDAASRTKRAFFDIAGFPSVLGVIDGTFIRIIAPKENEEDYVNRKGYHSLNVQMMCDHQFRVTNVTANWPGSAHDQRIFRNSILSANIENGTYDGLILGDSAYQCTSHVITPYADPNTDSKVRFNKALCRTRVLIEQTYGILKRRFACLGSCLRVCPRKAVNITMACVVLHNIGIEMNDIVNFDNEAVGQEGDIIFAGNGIGEMGGMREVIRQTFFP